MGRVRSTNPIVRNALAWDNLVEIYFDRAAAAGDMGDIEKAAYWLSKAHELKKIQRRADPMSIGNVSYISNPVVANAVASHRTDAERIDAEIMASGCCANIYDAMQWLVANRDTLMSKYGREEYLDALERWNRQ